MTESARVSCIVPVYNGARFVADALESILAQSHPVLELLVVDDGSTDSTPEVLARYADRIGVLRQANQGPAAARNAGIVAARGSFIAFLDADDVWRHDKLALQLARFSQRKELEILFANLRNVAGEAEFGADPLLDPANWPPFPFSPCTLLCRRQLFDTVGLFNPALRRGEDIEWIVRMMMRGHRYEVMPDVLVDRRIHRANLSREHPPGPEDVVRILKLVLDRRRAEGW